MMTTENSKKKVIGAALVANAIFVSVCSYKLVNNVRLNFASYFCFILTIASISMTLAVLSQKKYLMNRTGSNTKMMNDLLFGVKIQIQALLFTTLITVLVASYNYLTQYGWEYYAGAMLAVIISSLLNTGYALLTGLFLAEGTLVTC